MMEHLKQTLEDHMIEQLTFDLPVFVLDIPSFDLHVSARCSII
jgi:hypothetical protein